MKKIFKFVILFLVSGMFFSCGSTKKVVVKNELFSNDWVDCSKDNNQDCGKFYTSPELGKFKSIEVEFKKDSGYDSSCFGLVFGYSSAKNGICSDYIRFEINTLGEYALYSYDGKSYSDLVNPEAENTAYFSSSAAIVKGFSSLNRLKIVKNDKNQYSCYINGTCVKSSVSALENGTNGVMAFFSVGKSDQENLPDTPVSVSYRIVSAER